MKSFGEPIYGWGRRPSVYRGICYKVDDLRPFNEDGIRVESKTRQPMGFRMRQVKQEDDSGKV